VEIECQCSPIGRSKKSKTEFLTVTSSISESWQTGKWRDEVPLEELSPMWADWENAPDRHFYVDEVACTKAGKYILPKRWVVVNKEECAEGHPVYFSKRVSYTNPLPGLPLIIYAERKVSGQDKGNHPDSSKRVTIDIPRNRGIGTGWLSRCTRLGHIPSRLRIDHSKRFQIEPGPSGCKRETGLQPSSHAVGR